MSNYYNTVIIKTNREQGASFTQALDSFGTDLIEPRQAAYGGRSYIIVPEKRTIESQTRLRKGNPTLNIFDKVKVAVGYALKRVAAFFNKEIEAKYKLIDTHPHEQPFLFNTLLYSRKVIQKQGDDITPFINCAGCCVGCCEAGFQAAGAPPTRRHY